jgi:hypothetical protein
MANFFQQFQSGRSGLIPLKKSFWKVAGRGSQE